MPRSGAPPVLLFLAAAVGVAGAAWLLARPAAPPPVAPSPPVADESGGPAAASPEDGPAGTPAGTEPAAPVPAAPEDPAAPPVGPSSGGLAGVRTPHGEDLSDRRVVEARLEAALAAKPPAWAEVADLAAVHPGPLPGTLRVALESAISGEEGAGALLVYGRLRDEAVVTDLVSLLDAPRLGAAARGRVLEALATTPAGDPAAIVRAIEARLSGEPEKDLRALSAIARRGGAEATRVLVDAIGRAPEALGEAASRWTLASDPASGELVAGALRDARRTPAARAAIASVAGRPDASPAVVEALAALDAPGADDAVRTAAVRALAATGSPAAVERLLASASEGGDRATLVGSALSDVRSAPAASRALLVRAAAEGGDPAVRRGAVRALGTLREPSAVPALTTLLAGGDEELRREAVDALGGIGPGSAAAVPALAEAFAASGDPTRGRIAGALARIGTPEAERTLRQLEVSASTPEVRKAVSSAIASMRAKDGR